MSPSSTSLSTEERRQLRCFVCLVEEMLQSRFYRRLSETDLTFSLGYSPDERSQFTGPTVDWEAVRSFLVSFRQIAMNEKDIVYITRIRNIISRYAAPKFDDDLRGIKKLLTATLSCKLKTASMGMTTDESVVDLTGVDLLDILVNGELFHSGADHEKILNQLQSLPRDSYLWLILLDAIIPILHISWYFVRVILQSNLLQREDFPDRLRDSWDKWCRENPPASPDTRGMEPSPTH